MTVLTVIEGGAAISKRSAVMAAIRERCKSRGLSEMQRIHCENVGRDAYNDGASPAMAIEAGNKVAEKFASRVRPHSWRGSPDEPRPAA